MKGSSGKMKSARAKRDYSVCFMCGSDRLWIGPKQPFCLECKKPVSDCLGVNHRYYPPEKCHHKGKKDYFSICGFHYLEKVPQVENGYKDWNWIIETQRKLEREKEKQYE